jgi:hypothetical protein
MKGQCKLCLKEDVELQVSHFLPKGIYRILRDANEKNPNPWIITNNSAVQTSWQMTAYLLCRSCEQRLSKNGECWVLRHCLRNDGKFILASILANKRPDISENTTETRIYFAAQIPEIDVAALSYFAASIFWRGSIYPWNEDRSARVKLGPFGEQFREYLMEQGAFPGSFEF